MIHFICAETFSQIKKKMHLPQALSIIIIIIWSLRTFFVANANKALRICCVV